MYFNCHGSILTYYSPVFSFHNNKVSENLPDSSSKDTIYFNCRSNTFQATRYSSQVKYVLESFFIVQFLVPSNFEYNCSLCCLLVNSFVTMSRRVVSYRDIHHIYVEYNVTILLIKMASYIVSSDFEPMSPSGQCIQ